MAATNMDGDDYLLRCVAPWNDGIEFDRGSRSMVRLQSARPLTRSYYCWGEEERWPVSTTLETVRLRHLGLLWLSGHGTILVHQQRLFGSRSAGGSIEVP